MQESNRGEHISGGLDGNAATWKPLRTKPCHRRRSEGPVTWPALRADGAYTGNSCEEHAARRQNSIDRPHGGRQVVNVLQCLSQNEAIERARGDMICGCEVSDNRHLVPR